MFPETNRSSGKMSPEMIIDAAGWSICAAGTILIQLVGMFLAITSGIMFLKHGSLRKVHSMFILGMLVSYTIFLFVDWPLLQFSAVGCEIFSVTYLLFGSMGTSFAVCVAVERNKKMTKLLFVLISKKHYLVCFCLAVGFSAIVVICPIYLRPFKNIHTADRLSLPLDLPVVGEGIESPVENVCFYTDGLLYRTKYISITFGVTSVLMPTCFMTFCYINIYHNVRRARLNRWINQRCSRLATAIGTTASRRRSNIFQASPELHSAAINDMFSLRERSVLLKGLRSVSIILICWLPFSIYWICMSLNGFRQERSMTQKYLIILAKSSAVFNIAHHICFNVKYKRLYLNTILWMFSRCFGCSESIVYPEENTSQIDSNVISSCNMSTVYTLAAVARPNLAPIFEQPVSLDSSRNDDLKSTHEESVAVRRPSVASLPEIFHRRRCGSVNYYKQTLGVPMKRHSLL